MLWRSAPPKIMMRLNAPISALLALAVLYLLPVSSLAKTTHHHVSRVTATAHASKRQARKRFIAEPVSRSSRRDSHVVRDTRTSRRRSLAVTRTYASRPSSRHLRRRSRASRTTAPEPTRQKQAAVDT